MIESTSIVFLPGVRGNPRDTWTKEGVLWPVVFLAADIPDSRIFLFGFDTRVGDGDDTAGVSEMDLHGDAEDLCVKLAAERKNTVSEKLELISDSGASLIRYIQNGIAGPRSTYRPRCAQLGRSRSDTASPAWGGRESLTLSRDLLPRICTD